MFRALRTKWTIGLTTAGAILIAVAAITYFQPRTYTATANLVVNHVAPISWGSSTSIPVLSDLVVSNGEQTIETYAALLQSDSMAERVIRALRLKVTAKQLKKHLRIRPETNTNILGVAMSWDNAPEAARIANAYASGFMTLEREVNSTRARGAMRSIGRALGDARLDMLRTRSLESAFEANSGVADAPAQTTSVIAQIATLDQRIGQLRAERHGALAQLFGLRRMIASGSAVSTGQVNVQLSAPRAQLETQLGQVSIDLGKARTQFSDDYPVVAALIKQQYDLRARLQAMPRTEVASRSLVPDPLHERLQQDAATARSLASGDRAQLAAIITQRATLINQLRQLPGVSAQLANLKGTAAASETTYNALKEKYDQAVVASLIAMPDVAIIESADRLHVTQLPNIAVNLGVGLILALIGGICAALLAASRDRTIHDKRDIERRLGLPVLAQLSSASQTHMSVSTSVADFTAALRLSETHSLGVLLVCGAVAQDDAAWVASASAIGFARLGCSTFLLECGAPVGVSAEELAHKLKDGSLLAGCCGASPVGDVRIFSIARSPGTARLFASKAFSTFLAELKQRFDAIVVSAAPVNDAVETLALAARVDAVVVALSRRGATVDEASRAVRALAAIAPSRVLGAIYTSGLPSGKDADPQTGQAHSENDASHITQLLSASVIPASAWSKAPHR